MTYVEALHKLLVEHERQAKHPELWQDNPWKGTYYTLLNKVHNALEDYERMELQNSNLMEYERH